MNLQQKIVLLYKRLNHLNLHLVQYLLLNLGFRFTRPKMRAVCKTLDKIDQITAEEGAPALAVLVVREGDGLPGQGWWTGRSDYQGEWTGPQAHAHIRTLQDDVFAYWQDQSLRI